MKHDYTDIRGMVPHDPVWWDECGVPRYCDPHPSEVNCIYAQEVCFYHIKCQACGHRFLVCSVSSFVPDGSLQRKLMEHGVHYGDPPNIGCCGAGPTMSSEPQKVHSFWVRSQAAALGWTEVESLRGKSIRDD